jgi:hypothetical protein
MSHAVPLVLASAVLALAPAFAEGGVVSEARSIQDAQAFLADAQSRGYAQPIEEVGRTAGGEFRHVRQEFST